MSAKVFLSVCLVTVIIVVFTNHANTQMRRIMNSTLMMATMDIEQMLRNMTELPINHIHGIELSGSQNLRFLESLNTLHERVGKAAYGVRKHINQVDRACDSTKYKTINRVVSPRDGNYFQKISEHIPEAHTVWYTLDGGSDSRFVRRSVFLPVSNNCTKLETRALGRHINQTGCVEKIDNRKPVELSWNTLLEQNDHSYKLGPEKGDDLFRAFMHVIPNAVVLNDGDVLYRDTKIIIERCVMRKFQVECTPAHPEYDHVFTISQVWGHSFFHGAVEGLNRLSLYLKYLLDHPYIKLHVNGYHPYLQVLGLKPERIIRGTVRASVLYMPMGTPCFTLPFIEGQLLAVQLKETLMGSNETRDTVVLIKRSAKRWFEHHDAIYVTLEKHCQEMGLKLVVFDDKIIPAMHDTMNLFHRALVIVAPHGAGLTNMIFSQPGTLVIEALCHDNHNRLNICFQRMASVLGMRYYSFTIDDTCMKVTATDIEKPFVEYMKLLGHMT